ncbi:hypothetical protein NAEGRDRAFT_80719 [Naegleria gruberi]|uniref:SEC7 domain-containing protein n=1 Tax=Naegleria gruberi TaxID=5762 RepID=D2VP71_NAEGR|nr:uncharacterized protein NAEGRDRAFT_80719 [Naegleria gruberi]EFC41308.1 hypothetical protein NAEGRDRAFT_80719 [Naegleria gruberi]|eukprot:XP_002674052.1 hypothetical protein NAEGRDRAFT_80719 [Naegleria gruberi strain NEG-M]
MSIRQKLFPQRKRMSGIFESEHSPTDVDSLKKNRRVSNASDMMLSHPPIDQHTSNLLNTSLCNNPSMSEDSLSRKVTIGSSTCIDSSTGSSEVDSSPNNNGNTLDIKSSRGKQEQSSTVMIATAPPAGSDAVNDDVASSGSSKNSLKNEEKNASLLPQQDSSSTSIKSDSSSLNNNNNNNNISNNSSVSSSSSASVVDNIEDDMTKNRSLTYAVGDSKFKGIGPNDVKSPQSQNATTVSTFLTDEQPSTISPTTAMNNRFQGISSKDAKPTTTTSTTSQPKHANPPPIQTTSSVSNNGKSSTPTNNKPASSKPVEKPRVSQDLSREAALKKKATGKSLTMPSSSQNKIVVIGCRGIGKSEMVYKFLHNEIRFYHQLKKDKAHLLEELKGTLASEQKTINEKKTQSASNQQNATTTPTNNLPSSSTSCTITPKTEPSPTKVQDNLPIDPGAIVENEIECALKPSDSLEVRKLKLLLMKKDQEIKKQKEEMENTIQELSSMWKKERTEKVELEEEYVEKENELNHYISVVEQIHHLINLDPKSDEIPEAISFKLPENPNNGILSPNRKRKTSAHAGVIAATPKQNLSTLPPSTPNVVTPMNNRNSHNNNHNDDFFDLQNFNPKDPVPVTPMSSQRKARHVRTESTFQKLRTNQYQVVAQDLRKSIEEDIDADVSDPETNSIALAANETDETTDEINMFLADFNRTEESNFVLTNNPSMNRIQAPQVKNSLSNSEDSAGDEDTENDYSESSDITSVSSTASSNHSLVKAQSTMDVRGDRGQPVVANSLILPNVGKSKSPTIVQSTDYKYDENLFVKLLTPSFHLTEGLRKFNTGKPKDALKYLIENAILPDPEAGLTETKEKPEAVISRFMAIADSLNKEKLGEFLGDERNNVYLEEFVRFHVQELYNEEKKQGDDTYLSKFDRALRSFFIQFKLPKEGQQVTRIAEVFANVYSENNKNDGELNGNGDACYLLVCSMLMVNTQLHNPIANIKLSREQFVELFSQFKDINMNFIGSCYDTIARNAMVLYDEEVDSEDRTNFESDDQIDLFFKCYKPRAALPASASDSQITVHRAIKSLSLDGDKVKELMESAITFFFKAKVIHDGVINRIQIKDSDPNLELTTTETITESGLTITKVKLRDPTEINNEAKTGNYFICAYSVADRTSFLIVEHIIKAIRKAKRRERKAEKKKNKSSKTKPQYSTLTGSVTEELLQMLNGDDSDYNNDKFMVLVGCKADVPDDQRQVSKKEGGELALKYSIPFFEVSNGDMFGIRKVFLNAIDSIKRQNASYVDAVKQMNDFHKRMNIAKQNKKGQIDVNSLAILPKCYI